MSQQKNSAEAARLQSEQNNHSNVVLVASKCQMLHCIAKQSCCPLYIYYKLILWPVSFRFLKICMISRSYILNLDKQKWGALYRWLWVEQFCLCVDTSQSKTFKTETWKLSMHSYPDKYSCLTLLLSCHQPLSSFFSNFNMSIREGNKNRMTWGERTILCRVVPLHAAMRFFMVFCAALLTSIMCI